MEPPAWNFDALVVGAPNADPGSPHDTGEQGPFEYINVMKDLFSGFRCCVPDGAGDLKRDVLIEFPSQGDIDELRSVTDGQHGFRDFVTALNNSISNCTRSSEPLSHWLRPVVSPVITRMNIISPVNMKPSRCSADREWTLCSENGTGNPPARRTALP